MKLCLISLGVLGAAIAASACTDPVRITARDVTVVDTLTVYALSGTSPALPSGLDVFTRQLVVVDGFAAFDVAFDIESATKVRIYPVRFVVTSPSGVRQVGIIKQPGLFEQLQNAPSGTYQTDSSVVVSPGEIAVIQTTRAFPGEFCQFTLQPYLYAKLSVISVDTVARTIQFQLGIDPNCGFRSFQPGLPTS
ncbi:MAG: hypothetical protein H0W63_09880 [Gemmatimonadaceae bacterium]|nr:hypothetical protein [Gemmatimonadaceae bacterium]